MRTTVGKHRAAKGCPKGKGNTPYLRANPALVRHKQIGRAPALNRLAGRGLKERSDMGPTTTPSLKSRSANAAIPKANPQRLRFNEYIRRLKSPHKCTCCKRRAAVCELVNPADGRWWPLCVPCLDEF